MTLLEDALVARPFPQLSLLSEQRFASFLRDRGLNVGIGGISSFVESGLIEKLGDEPKSFHPFQVWPISELFKPLDTNLDVGISRYGLDPEGLKRFIDLNWSRHAEHLDSFPQSNACLEFNGQIFPLLLWLESYFIPSVRGVIRLQNPDESPDAWHEWRKSCDIQSWLSQHSISIERLAQWRDSTLFNAHLYDRNPDLYLLLRSVTFQKRDRFRNRLRLAYDLYEIAEITRLFLERLDDRSDRKEWDPTGDPSTAWVERLYGSQPKFGAPEFLRPLVRSFGLDPAPRVRWIVEGETEEGFILRYAERMRRNIKDYATVANLGGDGAFIGGKQMPALIAYLEAAKDEQCFSSLTFDDSSEADKRMKQLVAERLVSLCFALNRPDFELENFQIAELVSVAMTLASDSPYPIQMGQDKLIQEVENRINEKKEGFKKALNSVLHLHGEKYKLSKGIEWGSRLADFLSDMRDAEVKARVYSEDALVKIERQMLLVLRGSSPVIDFPLSVEDLESKDLEIPGAFNE
ncbi:MAG: hypothetical protein OXU21_05940 [Chloroflexota bacterium]|nr:hypothetical protein [Chloroflexota bacterium]